MLKKSLNQEIGGKQFPLELDLDKSKVEEHPLCGQIVIISNIADEKFLKLRGKKAKVLDVYTKNSQIAALKVSIGTETFIGAKYNFFISRGYLEDIFIYSSDAMGIRGALGDWSSQKDYHGSSWDGLEAFHFELAKTTDLLGLECSETYKYPSSYRFDRDGLDWRYIIPTKPDTVVVNAHSLLHDNVWTLNTTIFNTRECNLSKVDFVGDQDHWRRTLLWTKYFAGKVSLDNESPSELNKRLDKRLNLNLSLNAEVNKRLPEIVSVFKDITGKELILNPLSVGFSNVRTPIPGIAVHEKPSDIVPYSIITINLSALKDLKYLIEVIKHELIHYVIESYKGPSGETHGDLFQEMAKRLNLPRKFRD